MDQSFFTIGHSTRAIEDFVGLLKESGVTLVVDARTMVLVVGLSGFDMVWKFDLWDRFHSASFWWMHAMVCAWALFAFVRFIAEPFILKSRFHRWAHAYPDLTFLWVQRAHWVLVGLAWIAVFGAVAGSHGWSIF